MGILKGKPLRELAEEVGNLKGTTWDNAFPFEVLYEGYPEFGNGSDGLVVGIKDKMFMGGGGNVKVSIKCTASVYKLLDPCMWSVKGSAEGSVARSGHLCNCEMMLVLQQGCKCGGS